MKRGYTLIEIIITIAIISILTSVVSLGSNYYKKTSDKIKNQAILTEVKEFLSFAKSYCREKNESGKISISSESDRMIFWVNYKLIKEIEFKNDFKIGGNFNNGIIDINNEGFITKYGTISIYKNTDYIGIITIAVSIDTTRIYENDILEVKTTN